MFAAGLFLEQSLDWLRSFWVFVSIVLIVMLAFLTFVVIWLFSIGVTIADFAR